MNVVHGAALWRTAVERGLRTLHAIRVVGAGPPPARAILAVKHTGILRHGGLLAASALGWPVTFVGSEDMLHIPLIGAGVRCYGGIFVGAADQYGGGLVDACAEVLEQSEVLGLMVDGRQMDARRGVTHRGAAWLAARLNAVIVPVAVHHPWPWMATVAVAPAIASTSTDRASLDRITLALDAALSWPHPQEA